MENVAVKYYSINGEDYLLWHFFGKKRKGFFIDIGAFDGIHLSNTFTFERMGWKGLCVEPNPKIFEYCKRNRPDSLCLNEACVGNPEIETTKFFVDDLGLFSSIICDYTKLEDLKIRYQNRGLNYTDFQEIRSKANTLNKIIGENFPNLQEIDFISIDTEGNEGDVLEGIDFNKYDIRVFVVEANSKNDENKLSKLMRKKGNYKLARKIMVNLIFVKTYEDIEKMQEIKIHCEIEKQIHPFGEAFTKNIFLQNRVVKIDTNFSEGFFK